MPEEILLTIESIISDKIIRKQHVGGGCSANNFIIECATGSKFFLKTGGTKGMFTYEANGLQEIKKSQTIRVPDVIYSHPDFLLLEIIIPGHKKEDFFEILGKKLAEMHMYAQPTFGFFEDNFIGTTPQINQTQKFTVTSWTEFYFQNRLLYQYKLAERNGYITSPLGILFSKLESKIHSILDPVKEVPSLLHGDLWGGNYLCDENHQPVLIDPAVYYGHRETDLAMTRLFGGFSSLFYESYHKTFPLTEGWEYRENIYKLYHILNHLNMFGCGYLSEAEYLMRYYV